MRPTASVLCTALFLSSGMLACSGPGRPASSSVSSGPPGATAALRPISAAEIEGHLRFLADDLLEGRAVGTPGIALAAAYHESVFRSLGLAPAFGSSYRQSFSLTGSRPDPKATLVFAAGGKRFAPALNKDFVLGSHRRDVPDVVEGDLVYVGYGIQAPGRGWDDIKGEDLSGKVLLFEVNEPGNHPGGIFEGTAMTYYGRWTYKLEQASRLGARGVLIIHHPVGAAYGWDVVQSSWSREELFLPGNPPRNLFHGWISAPLARQILAAAGLDRDDLRQRAEKPTFRPMKTGIRVEARQRPTFRETRAENVAAILRGGAARDRRHVVVSAHFDHLGRDASKTGDGIYNGAVDNCSASAAMLALARRLADRASELPVNVIFLGATAEEVGLLGSRHFATHLPVSREKVWADINFEMTNVWGETEDVYAIGARESELDAVCRRAAGALGLRYTEERSREDGFFYRSDQVSFARVGIASVWLHEGVVARGADRQRVVRGTARYKKQRYHKVGDEPQPDWDLRGTAQIARWAEALVFELGKLDRPPRFLPTSAFAGR